MRTLAVRTQRMWQHLCSGQLSVHCCPLQGHPHVTPARLGQMLWLKTGVTVPCIDDAQQMAVGSGIHIDCMTHSNKGLGEGMADMSEAVL